METRVCRKCNQRKLSLSSPEIPVAKKDDNGLVATVGRSIGQNGDETMSRKHGTTITSGVGKIVQPAINGNENGVGELRVRMLSRSIARHKELQDVAASYVTLA